MGRTLALSVAASGASGSWVINDAVVIAHSVVVQPHSVVVEIATAVRANQTVVVVRTAAARVAVVACTAVGTASSD